MVIFHPRMVLRTFLKADFIIMVQFSSAGKVRVPKQLFVNTDPSSIPAAVRRAGLSLPLGKSTRLAVCDALFYLCSASTLFYA